MPDDAKEEGSQVARLLPLRIVAKKLFVSQKTVRRWVESGEFPRPVLLPGGDHRWPEQVVDGWIAIRQQETGDLKPPVKGKT